MKRLVAALAFLFLLSVGAPRANALTCPAAVTATSPAATSCWPLQETSGTTITDTIDSNSGTITGGYTLNQNGAIACNNTSVSGVGCSITTPTQYANPQPMTLYVDFAGTSGGIAMLAASPAQNAFAYYVLFLDTHGKLNFGVNNFGVTNVLQSPLPYADGNEHKAVISVGAAGMKLYVDGSLVASRNVTLANFVNGYWFLGGINPANWQLSPSEAYFNGSLYSFASWTGTQLTDAQGITLTGGNPNVITNSYCSFANQIASLNPATAQAFANSKLTFKTTALQLPGGGSNLPIAGSTQVCTTDATGTIRSPCQIQQGAHVNLSVGTGPPIPLVIPFAASCDLTAIMLSQTDPPMVVSAVAVAGPLFAGTTVTNPPAGTIGTATITAPNAFSQTQASAAIVNIGLNGNVQQVILTGNAVAISLTNFVSGANFVIDTTEDGTGGRTTPVFSVPAGWSLVWPGAGSQPALPSTAANAHNIWQFTAINGTQLAGNISSLSTGTFPLSGTANFNDYSGINVNTIQMGTYTSPTLAVSGTCSGTCATTYTYEIDCLGDASTHALPSATQTVTNAATLDGTHFNALTWTPNSYCHAGYNVYGRIGGALGLIGTVGAGVGTFTDNSMAAVGAAPPTTSTMGAVIGDLIGNTRTLTTLGDILYENSTPANARLAGNVAQLATPSAPVITNAGTTGATTYTYFLVCNDAFGGKTLASASGATTTGNAALSASNYNIVTFPTELGCVSFDVLKVDTAHSVSLANTTGFYNDQGAASSAYVPPATNTTAIKEFLSSIANTSTVAQAPAWSLLAATQVPGFDGVTVTGIPVAGQVPIASSATAATWTTPQHGQQLFTTTGTFTVPANVYSVTFAAWGPGGGGGGLGAAATNGADGSGATTVAGGGVAGATLTANAGKGGVLAAAGALGACTITAVNATNGTLNISGGIGSAGAEGTSICNSGNLAPPGGSAFMPATSCVPATATVFGVGGGGGAASFTSSACGGNGGAYASNIVTTTPTSTFAVTVGTGGAAGTGGTANGAAGSNGAVLATW